MHHARVDVLSFQSEIYLATIMREGIRTARRRPSFYTHYLRAAKSTPMPEDQLAALITDPTQVAALLAAVLPSPKRLHVRRPSAYVRERQRWIIAQMRQLGGTAYLEHI